MRVRHLDIRDFRKIARRSIEDLQDGLNIVVGDNEAGKSTMLAALRTVFFERHRVGGSVAEAMQPYGGSLRPQITVGFDIDGQAWTLSKAFCQRPEASLVGPGERLSGDAVEERLSVLLGFTHSGRGGSKPDEHQGTHGLLWVEQGTRETLGVGAGRETLASALEREVGQVTGGERGRALLAGAADRRRRFWDKRDRPVGTYSQIRRDVESLVAEQAELLERHRRFDATVDRLAAVTEHLARHLRDDRLANAGRALAAAAEALAAAERRIDALGDATAKRLDAERHREQAAETLRRRRELVAEVEAARAGLDKAGRDADEARAVERHRSLLSRESDARLADARAARNRADAVVDRIEAGLAHRQAKAALAAQELALAAAEELAEKRRQAFAQAEAWPMTPEQGAALTTLERGADRARAQQTAAGIEIVFAPEAARRIFVDEREHPSSEPLALSRDAAIDLEGFGRLSVRLGGDALQFAKKAESAERAYTDALRTFGVTSAADAMGRIREAGERRSAAATFAQSLASIAPEGIEVLRQGIERARWQLAQAMPDHADDSAGSMTLDQARAGRAEARAAEMRLEKEQQAHASGLQAAVSEAATLIERAAGERRRADALAGQLQAARIDADDDLLVLRLRVADDGLVASAQDELQTRQAAAATDIDAARLSFERCTRMEQEIRKDIDALAAERHDLEIELRAVGHDGLGERIAEVDGRLISERRRLAAMDKEAAASRILHDALVDAQRQAKDRWLGPVRRRVQPYLKLVHPESDVVMDEHSLEIQGLVRGGVQEAFAALSMGAREQVAVITRLALADVLRDAGHPAVVILDDALVNTDEARLERMHNVLTRAAQSLQILIFTCRERDFLGLGATHRI